MPSRKHLAVPALCALVVGACESPAPTAPTVGPSGFRAAAATTSTVVQKYPVNDVLESDEADACLGESIAFQGTFHTVTHVTENANGFHLSEHDNASGIKAVGLTSGTRYVGTQADNYTLNVAKGSTETATGTFKAIGQGKAPNLTIKYVFHATVNANGQLTSFVDKFSVVCK